MENQKSSSSLKVIVAILAILLVGSLVYIFKMTSDADVVQTELKATLTEKESVMKDLEELKSTYDAAIAENTSMSDELIQESQISIILGEPASGKTYQLEYFDENMDNMLINNMFIAKMEQYLCSFTF